MSTNINLKHNSTQENRICIKGGFPEEIANHILKLKNRKAREDMGSAGRKRFLESYKLSRYTRGFVKVIRD